MAGNVASLAGHSCWSEDPAGCEHN